MLEFNFPKIMAMCEIHKEEAEQWLNYMGPGVCGFGYGCGCKSDSVAGKTTWTAEDGTVLEIEE